MPSRANSPIRVLIADDHPVIRRGLRAAFAGEPDIDMVGEATSGNEAVVMHQRLQPTVTLMDLQMPDGDGLEAIAAIRRQSPDASIIVLTSFPGDARIIKAITLGAMSYLLKLASIDDILRAVRSARSGRHFMTPEVAHQLATNAGREQLTEREIAVLRLVARGWVNKVIADALFVSEETVKSRIRSLLGKLGALDRTHAVALAIQRGYIAP